MKANIFFISSALTSIYLMHYFRTEFSHKNSLQELCIIAIPKKLYPSFLEVESQLEKYLTKS
jgi:hypothetical protein